MVRPILKGLLLPLGFASFFGLAFLIVDTIGPAWLYVAIGGGGLWFVGYLFFKEST